jgi:cysteine desulfurase
MKTIYLDNNATTKIAPEVLHKMHLFFTKKYGNPSSMHTFGGKIYLDIEQARKSIADLIGADASEVIFTSGGTEGDNTAIMSALHSHPDKKHLITTKVEHPAILNLCKHLQTLGYLVTYLDVDKDGLISLDDLKAKITSKTAIISIIYVNNETGVISPIEEIAKIAKEHKVLFHTDAVQAVGKLPIDVSTLPVDMLSLSSHKLHGPKGVGALYVRGGTKFTPFIIGGHQESGRRGGTENVHGIVGFGKAVELMMHHHDTSKIKYLRDKLERGILTSIADTRLNGRKEKRVDNTCNISFAYVEGEAIILKLDEIGICASSGSACTSTSLAASHVLQAMDITSNFIQGSIRFSLSRYTTEEEIDYVLKKLPPIITALRKISPYGHKL